MKKQILWALLTVTATVFAMAFGAAAEVGVTDTEIHIGQCGPQTGPAAAWGSWAAHAAMTVSRDPPDSSFPSMYSAAASQFG